MEEVRQFYISAVGLEVGPRPAFQSLGYWLYVGSQDVLHLTKEQVDNKRHKGSDLTFDHVAFECTDLVAFKKRLKGLAVQFIEQAVPQTGRTQLFFRDPAGNGVELTFPIGDVQLLKEF